MGGNLWLFGNLKLVTKCTCLCSVAPDEGQSTFFPLHFVENLNLGVNFRLEDYLSFKNELITYLLKLHTLQIDKKGVSRGF